MFYGILHVRTFSFIRGILNFRTPIAKIGTDPIFPHFWLGEGGWLRWVLSQLRRSQKVSQIEEQKLIFDLKTCSNKLLKLMKYKNLNQSFA